MSQMLRYSITTSWGINEFGQWQKNSTVLLLCVCQDNESHLKTLIAIVSHIISRHNVVANWAKHTGVRVASTSHHDKAFTQEVIWIFNVHRSSREYIAGVISGGDVELSWKRQLRNFEWLETGGKSQYISKYNSRRRPFEISGGNERNYATW